MPPRHRCSRVSSRRAFEKYLAIAVANRLVGSCPVEPGRDGETATGAVRGPAGADRSGRLQPCLDRAPVRRPTSQEFQGRSECVRPGREVRTEIRGLHRAGTSSGNHQPAGGGERRAQLGGLPISPVAGCQVVAAHHADQRGGIQVLGLVVEGVGDRVVVQRGGQVVDESAPRGSRARPCVDRRVGAGGVATRAVQLLGRVETGSIRLERQPPELGEHERTRLGQLVGHAGLEPAAEEHRAAGIDPVKSVAAPGQVHGADEPAVQAFRPADRRVEVSERLDLQLTSGQRSPTCEPTRAACHAPGRA